MADAAIGLKTRTLILKDEVRHITGEEGGGAHAHMCFGGVKMCVCVCVCVCVCFEIGTSVCVCVCVCCS